MNKNYKEKICYICNNFFKPKNGRQKCCNFEHCNKIKKRVFCKKCNSEIIGLSNKEKCSRRYCDNCRFRICSICKQKFLFKPNANKVRKFCSKKCFNKWQIGRPNFLARERSKGNKWNWQGGKKVNCFNCKKLAYRYPKDLKRSLRHFCSFDCSIQFKKKAPFHTKEAREKIKLARARQVITKETKKKLKAIWNTPEKKEYARLRRLKQKFPTVDTSIERKTEEWLKSKNINYIHPFNWANKFQSDFYISALNLIIECDGKYWHSLPKAIKKDKEKDVCAKKCGFNLIRLTEEQINQGRFFELTTLQSKKRH